MKTIKEYLELELDEGSYSIDDVLKKGGFKPFDVTKDPIDQQIRYMGQLFEILAPLWMKNKQTPKKSQIDEIVRVLNSIKKQVK